MMWKPSDEHPRISTAFPKLHCFRELKPPLDGWLTRDATRKKCPLFSFNILAFFNATRVNSSLFVQLSSKTLLTCRKYVISSKHIDITLNNYSESQKYEAKTYQLYSFLQNINTPQLDSYSASSNLRIQHPGKKYFQSTLDHYTQCL